MKYKLILKLSIILCLFIITIECTESDCDIRPFRQLIQIRQLRNNRKPVKRSDNQANISLRNYNSELKDTMQTMQETLFKIRLENAEKIRNRRDKQKSNIKRKNRHIQMPAGGFNKEEFKKKFSNLVRPTPKPEPPSPPPESDAYRLVKNLKELRETSRSLAQKGLGLIEKALKD